MKEVFGNIWDFHDRGYQIVITTNGFVKKNGECVMGRGIALQAKERFPDIARTLGQIISEAGSQVWLLPHRLISFPVKHNWWEKAELKLVETSCKQLLKAVDRGVISSPVYLVRPGCKNGRLDWKDVKPILEKHLDDRFTVVEYEGGSDG